MASEKQPAEPESPSDPGEHAIETLSIAQALDLAKHIHQSGDLNTAGLLYFRILEAEPRTVEALHFAGLLQHQRGQHEEALALLRRSIELEPDHAGWFSNLGSVLIEQGSATEALDAFDTALKLDPANADAHNKRAVALRLLDRPEDAEAGYRAAVQANPAYRDAYNNLGRLLVARGRVREAISFHAKARELDEHDEPTRRFLIAAYTACGELDNALKILDEWRVEDPDNTIARHLRASISGEDVPERASDSYVEALFDRFAASFDVQLGKLGYRAPALVAEAVGRIYGPASATLTICDAGCGTGLCGPLLAPYKAHLTGVDLSERMLDKARARGCYDILAKAELTRFLVEHGGRFDLVVSADTLCYFGALGPVLGAAADALRPGGRVVFSVEASDTPGFSLKPHGRYAHHRDHVMDALAQAGLTAEDIRSDVLRLEAGDAVAGFLVAARKLD